MHDTNNTEKIKTFVSEFAMSGNSLIQNAAKLSLKKNEEELFFEELVDQLKSNGDQIIPDELKEIYYHILHSQERND